tara:strand:+ start:671 stop:985 length:315 start_codon:yes stop_codon:yes gene_type:complete
VLKARLAGKLDFSKIEDGINRLVEDIGKQTLRNAKANTPIRSGNARRNWSQTDSPGLFEVSNSVPYIEQLERGRSRQAPRGIIKPTVKKAFTGFTNISRKRITR